MSASFTSLLENNRRRKLGLGLLPEVNSPEVALDELPRSAASQELASLPALDLQPRFPQVPPAPEVPVAEESPFAQFGLPEGSSEMKVPAPPVPTGADIAARAFNKQARASLPTNVPIQGRPKPVPPPAPAPLIGLAPKAPQLATGGPLPSPSPPSVMTPPPNPVSPQVGNNLQQMFSAPQSSFLQSPPVPNASPQFNATPYPPAVQLPQVAAGTPAALQGLPQASVGAGIPLMPNLVPPAPFKSSIGVPTAQNDYDYIDIPEEIKADPDAVRAYVIGQIGAGAVRPDLVPVYEGERDPYQRASFDNERYKAKSGDKNLFSLFQNGQPVDPNTYAQVLDALKDKDPGGGGRIRLPIKKSAVDRIYAEIAQNKAEEVEAASVPDTNLLGRNQRSDLLTTPIEPTGIALADKGLELGTKATALGSGLYQGFKEELLPLADLAYMGAKYGYDTGRPIDQAADILTELVNPLSERTGRAIEGLPYSSFASVPRDASEVPQLETANRQELKGSFNTAKSYGQTLGSIAAYAPMAAAGYAAPVVAAGVGAYKRAREQAKNIDIVDAYKKSVQANLPIERFLTPEQRDRLANDPTAQDVLETYRNYKAAGDALGLGEGAGDALGLLMSPIARGAKEGAVFALQIPIETALLRAVAPLAKAGGSSTLLAPGRFLSKEAAAATRAGNPLKSLDRYIQSVTDFEVNPNRALAENVSDMATGWGRVRDLNPSLAGAIENSTNAAAQLMSFPLSNMAISAITGDPYDLNQFQHDFGVAILLNAFKVLKIGAKGELPSTLKNFFKPSQTAAPGVLTAPDGTNISQVRTSELEASDPLPMADPTLPPPTEAVESLEPTEQDYQEIDLAVEMMAAEPTALKIFVDGIYNEDPASLDPKAQALRNYFLTKAAEAESRTEAGTPPPAPEEVVARVIEQVVPEIMPVEAEAEADPNATADDLLPPVRAAAKPDVTGTQEQVIPMPSGTVETLQPPVFRPPSLDVNDIRVSQDERAQIKELMLAGMNDIQIGGIMQNAAGESSPFLNISRQKAAELVKRLRVGRGNMYGEGDAIAKIRRLLDQDPDADDNALFRQISQDPQFPTDNIRVQGLVDKARSPEVLALDADWEEVPDTPGLLDSPEFGAALGEARDRFTKEFAEGKSDDDIVDQLMKDFEASPDEIGGYTFSTPDKAWLDENAPRFQAEYDKALTSVNTLKAANPELEKIAEYEKYALAQEDVAKAARKTITDNQASIAYFGDAASPSYQQEVDTATKQLEAAEASAGFYREAYNEAVAQYPEYMQALKDLEVAGQKVGLAKIFSLAYETEAESAEGFRKLQEGKKKEDYERLKQELEPSAVQPAEPVNNAPDNAVKPVLAGKETVIKKPRPASTPAPEVVEPPVKPDVEVNAVVADSGQGSLSPRIIGKDTKSTIENVMRVVDPAMASRFIDRVNDLTDFQRAAFYEKATELIKEAGEEAGAGDINPKELYPLLDQYALMPARQLASEPTRVKSPKLSLEPPTATPKAPKPPKESKAVEASTAPAPEPVKPVKAAKTPKPPKAPKPPKEFKPKPVKDVVVKKANIQETAKEIGSRYAEEGTSKTLIKALNEADESVDLFSGDYDELITKIPPKDFQDLVAAANGVQSDKFSPVNPLEYRLSPDGELIKPQAKGRPPRGARTLEYYREGQIADAVGRIMEGEELDTAIVDAVLDQPIVEPVLDGKGKVIGYKRYDTFREAAIAEARNRRLDLFSAEEAKAMMADVDKRVEKFKEEWPTLTEEEVAAKRQQWADEALIDAYNKRENKKAATSAEFQDVPELGIAVRAVTDASGHIAERQVQMMMGDGTIVEASSKSGSNEQLRERALATYVKDRQVQYYEAYKQAIDILADESRRYREEYESVLADLEDYQEKALASQSLDAYKRYLNGDEIGRFNAEAAALKQGLIELRAAYKIKLSSARFKNELEAGKAKLKKLAEASRARLAEIAALKPEDVPQLSEADKLVSERALQKEVEKANARMRAAETVQKKIEDDRVSQVKELEKDINSVLISTVRGIDIERGVDPQAVTRLTQDVKEGDTVKYPKGTEFRVMPNAKLYTVLGQGLASVPWRIEYKVPGKTSVWLPFGSEVNSYSGALDTLTTSVLALGEGPIGENAPFELLRPELEKAIERGTEFARRLKKLEQEAEQFNSEASPAPEIKAEKAAIKAEQQEKVKDAPKPAKSEAEKLREAELKRLQKASSGENVSNTTKEINEELSAGKLMVGSKEPERGFRQPMKVKLGNAERDAVKIYTADGKTKYEVTFPAGPKEYDVLPSTMKVVSEGERVYDKPISPLADLTTPKADARTAKETGPSTVGAGLFPGRASLGSIFQSNSPVGKSLRRTFFKTQSNLLASLKGMMEILKDTGEGLTDLAVRGVAQKPVILERFLKKMGWPDGTGDKIWKAATKRQVNVVNLQDKISKQMSALEAKLRNARRKDGSSFLTTEKGLIVSRETLKDINEYLFHALHAIETFDPAGGPRFNEKGITWDYLELKAKDDPIKALEKRFEEYEADWMERNPDWQEEGLTPPQYDPAMFEIGEADPDGGRRVWIKWQPNEAQDAYARAVTGLKDATWADLDINGGTLESNQDIVDVLQQMNDLRHKLAREEGIDPIPGYVHHFSHDYDQIAKSEGRSPLYFTQAGQKRFRTGKLFRQGKAVPDAMEAYRRMLENFARVNSHNEFVKEVIDIVGRDFLSDYKNELSEGVDYSKYANLAEDKYKFGSSLRQASESKGKRAYLRNFGFTDAQINKMGSAGYASQQNGIFIPHVVADILKHEFETPGYNLRAEEGPASRAWRRFGAIARDLTSMTILSKLQLGASASRDFVTSILMNGFMTLEETTANLGRVAGGEMDLGEALMPGVRAAQSYGRMAKRMYTTPASTIRGREANYPTYMKAGVFPDTYYEGLTQAETTLGRLGTLGGGLVWMKTFADTVGKRVAADTAMQIEADRYIAGLKKKGVSGGELVKARQEFLDNPSSDALAQVRMMVNEYQFGSDGLNPLVLTLSDNIATKNFVTAFPRFMLKLGSFLNQRMNPAATRNLTAFTAETRPEAIAAKMRAELAAGKAPLVLEQEGLHDDGIKKKQEAFARKLKKIILSEAYGDNIDNPLRQGFFSFMNDGGAVPLEGNALEDVLREKRHEFVKEDIRNMNEYPYQLSKKDAQKAGVTPKDLKAYQDKYPKLFKRYTNKLMQLQHSMGGVTKKVKNSKGQLVTAKRLSRPDARTARQIARQAAHSYILAQMEGMVRKRAELAGVARTKRERDLTDPKSGLVFDRWLRKTRSEMRKLIANQLKDQIDVEKGIYPSEEFKLMMEANKDYLLQAREEYIDQVAADSAKYNQEQRAKALGRMVTGGLLLALGAGAKAAGVQAINPNPALDEDDKKGPPKPAKFNEDSSIALNNYLYLKLSGLSPLPEAVARYQMLESGTNALLKSVGQAFDPKGSLANIDRSGDIGIADVARQQIGQGALTDLAAELTDYRKDATQKLTGGQKVAKVMESSIPLVPWVKKLREQVDPFARKTSSFRDELANLSPFTSSSLPEKPDPQTGRTMRSTGASVLGGEISPTGNETIDKAIRFGLSSFSPVDVRRIDPNEKALWGQPGMRTESTSEEGLDEELRPLGRTMDKDDNKRAAAEVSKAQARTQQKRYELIASVLDPANTNQSPDPNLRLAFDWAFLKKTYQGLSADGKAALQKELAKGSWYESDADKRDAVNEQLKKAGRPTLEAPVRQQPTKLKHNANAVAVQIKAMDELRLDPRFKGLSGDFRQGTGWSDFVNAKVSNIMSRFKIPEAAITNEDINKSKREIDEAISNTLKSSGNKNIIEYIKNEVLKDALEYQKQQREAGQDLVVPRDIKRSLKREAFEADNPSPVAEPSSSTRSKSKWEL